MYAVLVVDDESVVCQGIRDYLFESGLNISKVWTASNGYEALDYIRMEQIDLVLTDIQMDGMNGIELMGSIQSEKADLPVVVISAHDAFEYAQQCIRLGARDYLIKPVRLANLVQVVGRALTERHERYKQVLEDSLKLKFSMTGMSSLRTYMLNELISGALAEADDYAFIFEQIGVALDGPYYAVIVVDLQWERAGVSGAEVRSLRDRNLLKYAAVNIIEETLSDWNAVTFYGQGNRIVVVLQMSEAEYVRQSDPVTLLNLLGKKIAGNILAYQHMDAVVGISPLARGLASMPGGYRQAGEASKWHGWYADHRVFYAEDFSPKEEGGKVAWQEKTEQFAAWMTGGKRGEDARAIVSRFLADISPVLESGDATGIALSVAYRAYAILLDRKLTANGGQSLDPVVYFRFPLAAHAAKERLTAYLTEAAELIDAAVQDYDHAIIRDAIEYIRRHYRNKGLKIQDVADDVHLSPNYLSYLFKQIAGETVWEYVTRLRMEEARHLLLHTAKKRYEISDEVGYESPEHFSRIFKRYYGESPNHVRG